MNNQKTIPQYILQYLHPSIVHLQKIMARHNIELNNAYLFQKIIMLLMPVC